MLVATGYFPPDLQFDTDILDTVIDVLNTQAKEAKRVRH